MKIYIYCFFFCFGLLLSANNLFAGDLDDGISTYTEDGVAGYDEMGEADKNINFIIVNAKSQAKIGNNSSDFKNKPLVTGDANMNSVVMGAGANINGDIIIIDQSKGSKTNISQ